jgi:hypothetical protein
MRVSGPRAAARGGGGRGDEREDDRDERRDCGPHGIRQRSEMPSEGELVFAEDALLMPAKQPRGTILREAFRP